MAEANFEFTDKQRDIMIKECDNPTCKYMPCDEQELRQSIYPDILKKTGIDYTVKIPGAELFDFLNKQSSEVKKYMWDHYHWHGLKKFYIDRVIQYFSYPQYDSQKDLIYNMPYWHSYAEILSKEHLDAIVEYIALPDLAKKFLQGATKVSLYYSALHYYKIPALKWIIEGKLTNKNGEIDYLISERLFMRQLQDIMETEEKLVDFKNYILWLNSIAPRDKKDIMSACDHCPIYRMIQKMEEKYPGHSGWLTEYKNYNPYYIPSVPRSRTWRDMDFNDSDELPF